MKFKTIDEMIVKLSDNTRFIMDWFLFYIKRKRHPDEFPIYSYQEVCRFYLDEYSEQEKSNIGEELDDLLWYYEDKIFENKWLRRK